MGKLFLLCFLLLPCLSHAQGLSLYNLLAVYDNKDEEAADVYLLQRGWERATSRSAEKTKTWAYGKTLKQPIGNQGADSVKRKFQAEAWLSITMKDERRSLIYSMPSQTAMLFIREQMQKVGMKRTDYNSTNERIIATYEGNGYRINIVTVIAFSSDGKNLYSFSIRHL